ncbi:MAG TPA: S53 family peptidase [Acidobacteriaceae bacterium]|jgi:kumamolisin|nr:S53 family peptidase [Acidobacteriaceae bacterium]
MAKPRFATQRRASLKGSERKPFEAAQTKDFPAKPHDESEPITVSVLLARKAAVDPRVRLTREEFARRHCARPEAEEAVRAFAEEYGLTVEAATEPGRRTLHLSGSQETMEHAFGVTLKQHEDEHGRKFRVREGAIQLPEELAPYVVAVLGLDNRPQAKPHFRIVKPRAENVSYTPVQVGAMYGFPANAKATGQTIGLLELGGGYREADITAYFKSLGIAAPTVTAVSVDKGTNSPGDANGADGEVMLDIEVSASIAVGAKVAVYFAPNTDQGFIDAITTAVHDTTNSPSVLSISWGGPESSWTQQAVTALDEACQAAASVGVTITVAAGDDGSTDGVSGSANHVDFPASSPNVLACGGTKLEGSGSTISSEVVWNELSSNEGATGGGVSTLFALPTWQAKSDVPKPTTSSGGRGVPDVAGDADPTTGYTIRVDGETTTIGGTSAVAPLWAGLIALANAANGHDAGFVNPTLYGDASAFRDITGGNNGSFAAGTGWDACTGLGSPKGAAIVKALGAGEGSEKKNKR